MDRRSVDKLISFWEGKLLTDRYLMEKATQELIKQTVKGLKFLYELLEEDEQ